MQGLGVFACRREAWLGFNSLMREFGAEEGYIHEKFRQAGALTLCLPFLKWVHRFGYPKGAPYPHTTECLLRNYMLGWREVGWDLSSIVEHFRPRLGAERFDKIWNKILT